MLEQLNSQFDIKAEKRPFRWWYIPLLIALIIGTLYAVHTDRTAGRKMGHEVQKCEGSIFGTVYHITYMYEKDLHDSIKSVLNEVDQSLSPFNKTSIITAINENRSTQVNDMFAEVFTLAKAVSQVTDGAFDITVAPLVNAWGFGFRNQDTVNDDTIQALLQHVGIEKVRLEERNIVKADSCVMLDCSAIAKGYGVDAVGKYLEKRGISDYMVEIGGEIRVRGKNPKGEKWNIAITKPEDDNLCQQNDVQEVLHVTDIAMATSGNYRNYYEKDNKKYAHTIDPHTGYPVQHSILSSTVFADDCATADAFATAFMVMGLDKARELLKKHKELQAYIIYSVSDDSTAVWQTDKIKQKAF